MACHLTDAVVTILGPPSRVTAFNRATRGERDSFQDNQLAVLEYPRAVATIRCNHVDPFGFPRRFFEVVGTEGNYLIRPLEPPRAVLSLQRPRGEFKKGSHELSLPRAEGRYDDEFRDLASVIRGEKKLRWDRAHDLAVHEAVLRGSGMTIDASID